MRIYVLCRGRHLADSWQTTPIVWFQVPSVCEVRVDMSNNNRGDRVSVTSWFDPDDLAELEEFVETHPETSKAEVLREGARLYMMAFEALEKLGGVPVHPVEFRSWVRQAVIEWYKMERELSESEFTRGRDRDV